MDSDLQRSPPWTEDPQESSAAFTHDATRKYGPALLFRTHWSRILHYDLFAPANDD